MTIDEMKTKLGEIDGKITELEQSELQAYADLGRKLFAELDENTEHVELVSRIREASEKLEAIRKERNDSKVEYEQRLAELTCYSCKAVNPEGAAFCEECGAKLGEKPKEYCEGCGTMNHPGQKFCGECGAKLATE